MTCLQTQMPRLVRDCIIMPELLLISNTGICFTSNQYPAKFQYIIQLFRFYRYCFGVIIITYYSSLASIYIDFCKKNA